MRWPLTFLQHIQRFVNHTWMQRYEVPLSDSSSQLIWSFILAVLSLGGWAGTIHGGRLPVVYGRWGNGPNTHTHTHTFLDRLLNNSNYSTIRCSHVHICTKSVFLYSLTRVFCFFFFRKKILLLNNVVAIVAALLMVFSRMAKSFEMIFLGRFLYGYNIGKAHWSSHFCRSFSLSPCSFQVSGWMCTSCILESLLRGNSEVFWLSQDPFSSD